MSREVPFKDNKVCDQCGAAGAYDFMGDYYCQDCTDEMLSGPEETEAEGDGCSETLPEDKASLPQPSAEGE